VGTKASSSWKKQCENEHDELTKHLRMMVVFILQLPNKNQRFYECKLASLLLLMNDASNYADLLVQHHNVVDQLLTILWLQLNTLLIEHAGEVHSERNATIVLPILIVLNHLVSCNHDIWGKVKEYIFPSCDENVFLQKVEMHQKEVSEGHPEEETQRNSRKNMHPIDAPVGTIRWKLIKLMTFAESNVKRCASELLWKICREDPGEFVLRCGFGNAVHMLGIKGLYTIPKSS
jgi:Guanine nucleotide exchange factor synembryn.